MQSKLPSNPFESNIRLQRIYALMSFIYNKQIPVNFTDFFQLIKLSAKSFRALQILQRYKINHTHLRQIPLSA